ncbi:MAG: DUF1175 domain-containing protein [Elusimicrobiota bacterium]
MNIISFISKFYFFVVCGFTILYVIASMDASFVQNYEPAISEELSPGDCFEVNLPLKTFEKINSIHTEGLRITEKTYSESNIRYKMQIIKQEATLKIVYSGFKEIVKQIKLNFQGWIDSNKNGLPDVVELDERNSEIFRFWFVNIAILQAIENSEVWSINEKDCAGLIRFAYKEALKNHDENWIKNLGFNQKEWKELTGVNLSKLEDVNIFNYPFIPVIGTSIFLTESGKFSAYADAYNLLRHNTVFVSKKVEDVEPGDILFFHFPDPSTFHSMIFTGDGLVYHTGPVSEDSEGKVKLWLFDDYMRLMPIQWLPVKENPFFLGFYRFKILNN